ncbi:MAG: hypothetical protein DMF90_28200 [Acidobacteria bacterium]|nr:MAG: hypothetical protein DMF90_28200 [Acidobacteriota bacterium]
MSAVRIVHMGLGPIGQAVARQVAQCRAFKIVGAIDVDPAKAGRDVGLVIGLARRLGITVQENAAATLRSAKPDIVVHCTSSSLARVMPELEAILAAKSAIVSTTEELVYPYHAHRRQATGARRRPSTDWPGVRESRCPEPVSTRAWRWTGCRYC